VFLNRDELIFKAADTSDEEPRQVSFLVSVVDSLGISSIAKLEPVVDAWLAFSRRQFKSETVWTFVDLFVRSFETLMKLKSTILEEYSNTLPFYLSDKQM
jgi:hypothetical protein